MRISFSLAGRTFFLLFGAIFSTVGFVFVYTGVQDAMRERSYEQTGLRVKAVVIGKSIQRAAREGNTRTRHEIAYRFTAADGRTRQGVDAVDVDEWERLAPGDAFQIAYLPGAPEMSRAAGSGDAATPYVMIGMGSLFALIGGSVLAVTGARIRRERRLLRTGLTAQGTVLAIVPTNVSVNRVQQLEVRYRYRDHSGWEHEGTSGALSPHKAHAVEVGDTLEVRFDQSKPEQSIWVRSE